MEEGEGWKKALLLILLLLLLPKRGEGGEGGKGERERRGTIVVLLILSWRLFLAPLLLLLPRQLGDLTQLVLFLLLCLLPALLALLLLLLPASGGDLFHRQDPPLGLPTLLPLFLPTLTTILLLLFPLPLLPAPNVPILAPLLLLKRRRRERGSQGRETGGERGMGGRHLLLRLVF